MNKVKDNLDLNVQEIKDKKVILKSYPQRMIVTLSTKCNSRCIMCEVVKTQWDIPDRVVDEIKFLLPYMKSINWQGGEVLVLDYFEKLFLESLNNKQLKQTIVTNGMLLNDRWIDLLTESNVELTVSIDGLDKEIYEKIRCGSKFDVLMKNLKKLNEIRKKKNSKLVLKMHTVVMRSNYKEVENFIEFAKRYDFDVVYMMPIYGGQDIPENIYINDEKNILKDLTKKIEQAVYKSTEYGINFFHSLPIIKEEKPKDSDECTETAENICIEKKDRMLCFLPWQQLNIDPGGEVRPGCLCKTNIGSVMDSSILDIWNNSKMQEYRCKILLGNPDICSVDCIKGNVPENMRGI
ncbi:MAG: radical SAM protein [Endomicrobiaceae bacterium]|nr:radical SAM protein [Endomicrobiaceae bacterium]